MLLEYLCLFVFILRLFHLWCFAAGVKFWRDKKNMILLAIIVVTKMFFLYKPRSATCWHLTPCDSNLLLPT